MKKERRKRRFPVATGSVEGPMCSGCFRPSRVLGLYKSLSGSTHLSMFDSSTTIHQPDFNCQSQVKIWHPKDHKVRFSVTLHPIFLFQDLTQWNNKGTHVWMETRQFPAHLAQTNPPKNRYKEIKESDQKDPSQARKRRLTCSLQIMTIGILRVHGKILDVLDGILWGVAACDS